MKVYKLWGTLFFFLTEFMWAFHYKSKTSLCILFVLYILNSLFFYAFC